MLHLRHLLFYIPLLFFSCGQPQQKETPEKKDSISQITISAQEAQQKNYWPQDIDTLVSGKEISLNKEAYNLKTIRYCTNDSAVANPVYNNSASEVIGYTISHNYSERITLTKGHEIIFTRQISKNDFENSLESGFYKRARLYDIQYDGVKADKLYFIATFISSDTSWIEERKFAIYYQTEKVGQPDFSRIESDRITYDDLELYDLNEYKEKKIGFISLSDNYPLSDDPNSPAMPDPASQKDNVYFRLGSQYRKRLLAATEISETDKVCLYNYQDDTLACFTVKDLKAAALLNIYSQGDQGPFSPEEYMIGFEIDGNVLKTLGYRTLVAISKENPFVQGELKPMAWKKIESSDFPFNPTTTMNELLLRRYAKTTSWKYETTDLSYFVQEFQRKSDEWASARRLLIVDPNTKEIINDILDFSSEGTSPTPLNYTKDNEGVHQWAGKLFKDKPPVIFGFEYVSFGCPYITFIGKSLSFADINCDNRH